MSEFVKYLKLNKKTENYMIISEDDGEADTKYIDYSYIDDRSKISKIYFNIYNTGKEVDKVRYIFNFNSINEQLCELHDAKAISFSKEMSLYEYDLTSNIIKKIPICKKILCVFNDQNRKHIAYSIEGDDCDIQCELSDITIVKSTPIDDEYILFGFNNNVINVWNMSELKDAKAFCNKAELHLNAVKISSDKDEINSNKDKEIILSCNNENSFLLDDGKNNTLIKMNYYDYSLNKAIEKNSKLYIMEN